MKRSGLVLICILSFFVSIFLYEKFLLPIANDLKDKPSSDEVSRYQSHAEDLIKHSIFTISDSLIYGAPVDYRSVLLNTGLPIVNSTDEKDVLPGGFRMSKVVTLPMENGIDFDGIADLNISGSSQFSELSLDALIRRIGRKSITIVNLRQEDGGFLEPAEGKGAIAFSYLMSMPWWTGENPAGNRTVEEIEYSEEEKMAGISKNRIVTIFGTSDGYAPTDTHQLLYKIDMNIKSAYTEKTLARKKGLGYFRIPDKKFGNMEFEHVDQFITFVNGVQADEWLHFHCKKGQSRTTLFMIMYDIMRNADRVDVEDIIKRQGPLGLGGADLFGLPSNTLWDHSFKKGWKEFLYQFHRYSKENKHNGFKKTWSVWALEKGIIPTGQVKLGDYYQGTTVDSIVPAKVETRYQDKILVLNTLNESKLSVQNFRSSDDLWLASSVGFSKTGLKDLRASGSNQYTKDGLALLIAKLKARSENIVVVDLRHDDHLFVNGLNISSFESKEALLKPRSPWEISQAELILKNELLTQTKLELHAIDTKYPKNTYDDRFVLTLKPTIVETPQ
ncbi:MAG TPA: hypothetical protein VGP47_03845, partial [Parachlamydiaceae bacterium]|nr:hypothetical protein [Parachlamydiaceae bacterium]